MMGLHWADEKWDKSGSFVVGGAYHFCSSIACPLEENQL